ncbi:alkaline phosphatase family protein [Cohnella pontilimi]|uniref:Alkaline phosphatase family protein n=1 Tax=Cohnella pontilimi TaxID=2564100 RepID=A0A4U0FGL9_9BACL|nr:alkaline phosphatase family protein [Cohnella pontilimi]TJY44048.1 alkaline phosphatase family protein [Cohnella pontilimi]
MDKHKKVLFIVADSLMYQAVDEGIKRKELPALQFLVEHGQYYKDLVSAFPTMSVTIDSSLLTGTYPDEHGVPGLIWYCAEEQRIVNYGTGPMEILRQGIDQVLIDAIRNLNGKHLNPSTATIYEELAERGLKSGSVNGIIYRGIASHTLSLPAYFSPLTSLPKEITVKGPDVLAFGALDSPFPEEKHLPDGLFRKLGFNDQYAVETVAHLVKNGQLPDFLYVYLSDMDQHIHRKGPPDLKAVIKLDGHLNALLEAFGSKEQALKQAVIMVTGDSGVSSIVPSHEDPVVQLPELLKPYHILKPGAAVDRETEVVLAVNETMAYVYSLQEGADRQLREMAELLRAESRIDLVAWKEKEWVRVWKVGESGELRYRSNGKMTDLYDQSWEIEGNHKILDLSQDLNGRLQYGEYPDGLRRLWASLHSHKGNFIVVTAKPGYELAGHSSPAHRGGGGHGTFHRIESLIPLIICGTDAMPHRRRIVDLKSYLLQLLQNGRTK